jgi:hypothetical protein
LATNAGTSSVRWLVVMAAWCHRNVTLLCLKSVEV